jgi:hypothetical protein
MGGPPGQASSMPEGLARSLTVCCGGGLCNRLQVLISGLALAEATGRAFRMLWPLNDYCGTPFRSLFVNDWGVADVGQREVDALAAEADWRARPEVDWLLVRTPHVIVRHNSWMIRPERYPGHEPLRARCTELFEQLEPDPEVRERIHRFRREHFRPEMIGVHLRRGDLLRVRPDTTANTAAAIARVERFLAARPAAGIFLCTDDGGVDPATRDVRYEGVRERFERRFGDRVVGTRPRSLDRAGLESTQDAVVDLFLLRGTQMFVGTRGSSFSDVAMLGRQVPAVFCGAAAPGYRRFELLAKMTGLYYLLGVIGRWRYGRWIPFANLWMWHLEKRLPECCRSPWKRL